MLGRLGIAAVQGVLFDLGVSSLQLDTADRGFTYCRTTRRWTCGWTARGRAPPPTSSTPTPPRELARVLRVYGEERFAAPDRRRASCASAREEPFTSTARLAELVRDSIPAATRRTGGHPAKRTFQALRIEVNDELARSSARCPPPSTRSPSAGGSSCSPTTRSRTGSSSRSSRRGASDDRPRRACRSCPGAPAPAAAADPRRGAARPTTRSPRNPRAASARLRAAERIRRDEDRAGEQEDGRAHGRSAPRARPHAGPDRRSGGRGRRGSGQAPRPPRRAHGSRRPHARGRPGSPRRGGPSPRGGPGFPARRRGRPAPP